jgi:hypothetical protein
MWFLCCQSLKRVDNYNNETEWQSHLVVNFLMITFNFAIEKTFKELGSHHQTMKNEQKMNENSIKIW